MINKKTLELIKWLTSDDTGMSSLSIVRYMFGITGDYFPPSDKWDRGCCIRALNTTPDWWDRLDRMKNISEDWSKQIELIKEERYK